MYLQTIFSQQREYNSLECISVHVVLASNVRAKPTEVYIYEGRIREEPYQIISSGQMKDQLVFTRSNKGSTGIIGLGGLGEGGYSSFGKRDQLKNLHPN